MDRQKSIYGLLDSYKESAHLRIYLRVVEVAEGSWHAAAINALALKVTDDGNRLDHEIREGECRERQEKNNPHLQIVVPGCRVRDIKKCCLLLSLPGIGGS